MTDCAPVVEVDMLIRRPAAEVYEAFADPDRITKFWLARSSGRLEPRRACDVGVQGGRRGRPR